MATPKKTVAKKVVAKKAPAKKVVVASLPIPFAQRERKNG